MHKLFSMVLLTLMCTTVVQGQTSTSLYLTSDASTTSGLLQLRTWGAPLRGVSYASADLMNQPAGDYLVQAFDTPAGVPNSSDTWQSILPAFLAVFMKQTAGTPGTLFPKFELFLNGPSGTPICAATGLTALTTDQTSYSLSCTPSADITVTPSDRYYLWVGVNSTATPTTSTQFQLTIGQGGGRGFGTAQMGVPIAAHVPKISGSDSQYYTAGTSFTISGTDLGATAGTVTFNGETAVVSSWSDTSITALVPNDAYGRSSTITVFNANSVQSNPWSTSVVAAINNLTPASGAIGSSVVISGSGFGPSVGSVFFGGGTTGIVTNWSDASITATVPPGTTTGSIYVLPSEPVSFLSNPFTFTLAQLVSLALTPPNPSVSANSIQQLQLTATGLYSDGSSADLTSSATWATSDRSVAMVLPTPGTRGIVGTANAGTAIITASFAGISGSTSVTVTPAVVPAVPNISSVSPATATAGTQVTVTGTGFGSSQGNGSVWLGSTIGSVVSWSDTQVIANVATGSTTGIAQIQQAGISSNSLPFTVITPIISSITPASGLPGTSVTISGTGFGTAQGTGQIWLGTAPGVVTSWSDTQIIAAIAAGSATGTAQVLQAGVVSNAVPFAVNTPSITSITPTSGVSGTSVTITGSGFGSAQGSGIVWIGSTQGLVVSWTDTQVVATVDSNAVSGIVRIQQNGIWSNALSFKVPPSLGTSPSVNINPNVLSMVVGETRSLQALDDGGNVLAGLTWASSDLTVATLSTDDPPIITALAPGHVTITAGNASSDLTVYPGPALPLGTVQWSLPGDGSGVAQILPAVPSDSGVDVFALQQSGNIQAVKTDGKVAWTSTVGTDKKLVPDFLGGLAVADSQSIRKLDGLTGQPLPAYNFVNPNGLVPPVLVQTDGTTFTVDGDTVVGIDPLTGRPKFNIQLEDSIDSSNGNCGEFTPAEFSFPSDVGQPIIAGDGFAYFPYAYTRSPLASNMKVCNADGSEIDPHHVDAHLKVLRVGTDGSAIKISLGDWSQDVVNECVLGAPFTGGTECSLGHVVTSSSGAVPDSVTLFGTLITNADQGAFYSWDLGFNGASPAHQLTTIIGSSVSTISLPVPGSLQPMLQGSDGTLFGTVSLPPDPSGNPGSSFITALDALGNPKWTAPNLSPKYLTDDGNVVAQSPDGTIGVTLNQNGNTTTQAPDTAAVLSWTGNWYGSASSVQASLGITKYAFSFVDLALSFWPTADGNLSGSHQPPSLLMTHMYPFPDLTGVSADKIKSDTRLGVPLNPKTDFPVTHTFLIGDKVSSSSFLDAIESTSQATAFIGHSQSLNVLLEDGSQAVRPVGFLMGVERSTQSITDFTRLVMAPYVRPTPPGLEYLTSDILLPNYVPQALWIQQGPMRPRANVIFLGSCGAYSLPFQYWFNIHSDTKQHALIVPTDDLFTGDLLEVPAGVARFEWILIAQGMAQGKTVQQALDAANAQIHVPGQFDVVVPASFHWVAIGDANLKLRPISK
jgi:hypothetical protein